MIALLDARGDDVSIAAIAARVRSFDVEPTRVANLESAEALVAAQHQSFCVVMIPTDFHHDKLKKVLKPIGIDESLSDRELEVLRYLLTSLTSTEIAQELYISPNTVRFHIKNIYSKLGVHQRAAAVERARDVGLI